MFRVNHLPQRELTLVNEETGEEEIIHVEYIHENTFNAFLKERNGVLTSILLNAEVEINPDLQDDLIIRTEHETYKVDYYLDHEDTVTQLDYEGNPLPIVSKLRII